MHAVDFHHMVKTGLIKCIRNIGDKNGTKTGRGKMEVYYL